MFNRPNEKDQINRIIKNSLSTYGGGAATFKAPNLVNVSAIIPQ